MDSHKLNSHNIEDYINWISQQMMGEIDSLYDPEKDLLTQSIFLRDQISDANFLMQARDGLIRDLLQDQDLLQTMQIKGRNVLEKKENRSRYDIKTPDSDGNRFPDLAAELVRKTNHEHDSVAHSDGWKNIELKYHDPFANVYWKLDTETLKADYPTAYTLLEHYGEDVPIASYSYLAPMTSIHRHTGPENRLGEFIRIHIPLIIPEGDLFFEVNGDEVHWNDIFAFDNQLVHSAHNFSHQPRLIFLIDIRRSRLGLPPGKPWNKDRQLYSLSKPFKRTHGNR